ncbi:hypothetical protein ACFWOL_07730 [Streptomyces sp. NPDC058442]|uniref:hypothetical protein n=1 Tax=Streptomyces sp. NPDC058442 TaxID=3346503 RepID=UPI0036460D9D
MSGSSLWGIGLLDTQVCDAWILIMVLSGLLPELYLMKGRPREIKLMRRQA